MNKFARFCERRESDALRAVKVCIAGVMFLVSASASQTILAQSDLPPTLDDAVIKSIKAKYGTAYSSQPNALVKKKDKKDKEEEEQEEQEQEQAENDSPEPEQADDALVAVVEAPWDNPVLVAVGAARFSETCVACHGTNNQGSIFFDGACTNDVQVGLTGTPCESFASLTAYIPNTDVHTGGVDCGDDVCFLSTAAYLIDFSGVDLLELEQEEVEQAPIGAPWEDPTLISLGANEFAGACTLCHGTNNQGSLFYDGACTNDVQVGAPGTPCESFESLVDFIPDEDNHMGGDRCQNVDCAERTAAYLIDFSGVDLAVEDDEEEEVEEVEEEEQEEEVVEINWEDPALIAAGADVFAADCAICHGVGNQGALFPGACAGDVQLGDNGEACESFETMVAYIPDAGLHSGGNSCADAACAESTAAYIIDVVSGEQVDEEEVEEEPVQANAFPHDKVKGGVGHGDDLKKPFESCVACHGADLQGAAVPAAPSCYLCHGEEW